MDPCADLICGDAIGLPTSSSHDSLLLRFRPAATTQVSHEIPIPKYFAFALCSVHALRTKRPSPNELPKHAVNLALGQAVVFLSRLRSGFQQSLAQLSRVYLTAVVRIKGGKCGEQFVWWGELCQGRGESIEVRGEIQAGGVWRREMRSELSRTGCGKSNLFECLRERGGCDASGG